LPEFLWETQQPKRKRDPNAPKLKRQRYTKKHKQTVLSTLHDSGSKLHEIAKQFQIPEGTLRGWYDEERRQKHPTGGAGGGGSSVPLGLGGNGDDPTGTMDEDEDEDLPEPTRLEHMEPHTSSTHHTGIPHTSTPHISHLPPPSTAAIVRNV
jgi:transposase-like protein